MNGCRAAGPTVTLPQTPLGGSCETVDYDRTDLPERVLLLGTGMLLRSLVAAAIDAANRRGTYRGGIVALESGAHGRAEALNAAGGRFTLIERGLENGIPVDRSTTIGSIIRAVHADRDQAALLDLVARPALQVIVSNASEAGWSELPARLFALLRHRAEQLPDGPPLLVIPTELVPDNGVALERAVRQLGPVAPNVHFAGSLVDRITTAEGLVTIAEPYAFWAIEGDPALLQQVFPIAEGERVTFARDISRYRDRKLYLLNAAHTALAPLAVAAEVRTVREATEHALLGPFFRHILFEELVPGSGLDSQEAASFAAQVWERFQNPFLEHQWQVIATNQAEKVDLRVRPVIRRYLERYGKVPEGLILSLTLAQETSDWSQPLKREVVLAAIEAFLR